MTAQCVVRVNIAPKTIQNVRRQPRTWSNGKKIKLRSGGKEKRKERETHTHTQRQGVSVQSVCEGVCASLLLHLLFLLCY